MKIFFDINIYNRIFDDQTELADKEDYLRLKDEIMSDMSETGLAVLVFRL